MLNPIFAAHFLLGGLEDGVTWKACSSSLEIGCGTTACSDFAKASSLMWVKLVLC